MDCLYVVLFVFFKPNFIYMLIKRLESEKPKTQADIEAGKRLQKDRNAPSFVSKSVDDLDRKWKDTNEKAAQKHDKLKVSYISLDFLGCV